MSARSTSTGRGCRAQVHRAVPGALGWGRPRSRTQRSVHPAPVHPSDSERLRDLPFDRDRPFTYQEAVSAGVTRGRLRSLVEARLVRRLLAGVYVRQDARDGQLLRARALALVVPEEYVVTDESAGWLAGAPMILRPGAHLVVPPLTMFGADGERRLRNDLADSGRRTLQDRDIHVVHGVRATTPLRTALDLGRSEEPRPGACRARPADAGRRLRSRRAGQRAAAVPWLSRRPSAARPRAAR